MPTPSLPTVGGSAGSWGTQLNAWLLAAHNADGTPAAVNNIVNVINVRDPKYGAVGNGIADDTAAIQAAIDAATGAANPATTIRAPVAPVYLPTGIYKIISDLNIRSVQGFVFFGDGQQSRLMPSGTGFTTAALFINGSANGVFRDFYIQGDGTAQLQSALRLDYVMASRADAGCVSNTNGTVTDAAIQPYDVGATVTGTNMDIGATITSVTPGVSFVVSPVPTASGTSTLTIASPSKSARGTTGNKFENIWIKATNAVTYFDLTGNGSAQLDGTVMVNVNLAGTQTPTTWSSTGNSINGFNIGCGVFANNYDHVGVGIQAAGFYYGYRVNTSSISIDGAQPANNFCDFWIFPGSQCSVRNVQSQSCNTFLISPGPSGAAFAPIPVSFEDIEVKTNNFNSANVVAQIYGGIWNFKNFNATNLVNTGGAVFVLGTFNIAGASSTRPGVVTFDNLSAAGARTSCILPTSGQAQIAVQNYSNYTVATGVYVTPVAGDLLSIYRGSAWYNLDTDPALLAPLASPTFTGTPAAPTPTGGDNTTKLATTSFVQSALPSLTPYATLASPTFTGTPAAPTPTGGDNTTKLATTAFVQSALPSLTPYAPLASPALTGTPTSTTPAASDNSTKIATTAFVQGIGSHGYHADCSSNLASFTAEADVPGATVSVVVNTASSDVMITGMFDMQVTTSGSLLGSCNWNGSDLTEQVVLSVAGRITCTGAWYISGVSAGTYTAKLRASFTGTSGNGLVRSTHSGISVVVLEGG